MSNTWMWFMKIEQDDNINLCSIRTYHSCFFIFIENDLFWNGIKQPQTPVQGLALSRAGKTKKFLKSETKILSLRIPR